LALLTTTTLASDIKIPKTYKEAMTLPEAQAWDEATKKEITSIYKKGVVKVVKLPKDAKCLPTRMVFKAKPTAIGMLDKLKARIIVRGDQQQPGIDYTEKFSPIARAESI
jgi:hypothetical protein